MTIFRGRSTKMRREMLLSRLLLAVTLVVTALMLAPTGAQAHAGHSHAIQPAATTVQRPADLEVIKVAPITIARPGDDPAGKADEAASLLPSSIPENSRKLSRVGVVILRGPAAAQYGFHHQSEISVSNAWTLAAP